MNNDEQRAIYAVCAFIGAPFVTFFVVYPLWRIGGKLRKWLRQRLT